MCKNLSEYLNLWQIAHSLCHLFDKCLDDLTPKQHTSPIWNTVCVMVPRLAIHQTYTRPNGRFKTLPEPLCNSIWNYLSLYLLLVSCLCLLNSILSLLICLHLFINHFPSILFHLFPTLSLTVGRRYICERAQYGNRWGWSMRLINRWEIVQMINHTVELSTSLGMERKCRLSDEINL